MPRLAQGFGLVEIMVSLLLGLIILLAISELFVSNSRTRSEIEKSAVQLENGRFAIQLLADEIANAGFSGERAPPFPSTVPGACVSPANEAELVAALGSPVVGGSAAASCVSSPKAGGDYVALRRVSNCSVGASGCTAFAEGHYHLQVSACETDLANPSGNFLISRAATSLIARTRACDAARRAPIYRFLSRIYYVNSQDVLVRRELVGTEYAPSEPLVEGIEKLAFEYGLDNNGDMAPDTYELASSVSDWRRVVSVRVWLVSRSLEATPGYTDDKTYVIAGSSYPVSSHLNHKRHVHSTVVRLNSLAGRR